MSPVLTTSLPPASHNDHHTHMTQDGDPISSPSRVASSTHLADHFDMGRPKERSHLEIILDSQHLALKGTGVDVEPALLSGRVMLYLSEDTDIKEITLQFRGKADLALITPEARMTVADPTIYTVCNHDWSFLEGDPNHSHTIKAGRHFFLFQLQIGGTFPSTIKTAALGGASVTYKLRAHAVRSGFSHNLQAVTPVYIDRSFSHEALEYQQTLEIEHTWPEKLMYSIMIPHKAWAAGDDLTAVLKFSPVAKGIQVTRITTSIFEATKVYAGNESQEDTHVVSSIQHDNKGNEVLVEPHPHHTPSPAIPASNSGQSQNFVVGNDRPSYSRAPSPSLPQSSSHSTISTLPPSSTVSEEVSEAEENNDTVITITTPIPSHLITPSHFTKPIIVSHRVRWNVLIRNLDGHFSELRCSLPIHILDHRLLEEARSFSAATRRLILGSSELPSQEEESGRELPSYDAHVRDRVANMFLPEAATKRVNNPWIGRLTSSSVGVDPSRSQPSPRTRTGRPMDALSHLPHTPGPRDSTMLDVLNCELLLSLSDTPIRGGELFGYETHSPPDHISHEISRVQSRNQSRLQSNHNTRPSSPECSQQQHDETTLHHGSKFQSVIRATVKPFAALTHHHGLFSRHSHHHPLHDHTNDGHISPTQSHARTIPDSPTGHPPHLRPSAPAPEGVDEAFLRRLFAEVPDYSIASRGFIGGGVPPLESMRGLPSYEEASRVNVPEVTSSDVELARVVEEGLDLGDRQQRSQQVLEPVCDVSPSDQVSAHS